MQRDFQQRGGEAKGENAVSPMWRRRSLLCRGNLKKSVGNGQLGKGGAVRSCSGITALAAASWEHNLHEGLSLRWFLLQLLSVFICMIQSPCADGSGFSNGFCSSGFQFLWKRRQAEKKDHLSPRVVTKCHICFFNNYDEMAFKEQHGCVFSAATSWSGWQADLSLIPLIFQSVWASWLAAKDQGAPAFPPSDFSSCTDSSGTEQPEQPAAFRALVPLALSPLLSSRCVLLSEHQWRCRCIMGRPNHQRILGGVLLKWQPTWKKQTHFLLFPIMYVFT